MDCPVGGEAAVQSPTACFASDAADAACEPAGVADLALDAEYWRREVAARLQRYRTRRKPRPPRYPSLRLPFGSDDIRVAPTAPSAILSTGLATAPALSSQPAFIGEDRDEESAVLEPAPRIVEEPEPFNNVIEFPRSAVVPAFYSNELADPVIDRPRIVEAPEVLPPPPAMGGILIDSPAMPEDHSATIEMQRQAAPLGRRLLAGLLDGLVLLAALGAFGAIFLWVNTQRPPVPLAIAAGAGIWALLWAAYKFLFLVYSGSTPGLRLTRLRLTRFDGSPATRGERRWRVLASYLSVLSLGLGYLWCVLDEDGLCWHDRMTRTYLS